MGIDQGALGRVSFLHVKDGLLLQAIVAHVEELVAAFAWNFEFGIRPDFAQAALEGGATGQTGQRCRGQVMLLARPFHDFGMVSVFEPAVGILYRRAKEVINDSDSARFGITEFSNMKLSLRVII